MDFVCRSNFAFAKASPKVRKGDWRGGGSGPLHGCPCPTDYASTHRLLSSPTILPSDFHIPWKNRAAVYLVPPQPGEVDPLRFQLQEPHLPVLGKQTHRQSKKCLRRHHLRMPRIWISRRIQPRGHEVSSFPGHKRNLCNSRELLFF
jgi:hypothetical protein